MYTIVIPWLLAKTPMVHMTVSVIKDTQEMVTIVKTSMNVWLTMEAAVVMLNVSTEMEDFSVFVMMDSQEMV